jgi:hypothetical protein
MAERPASRHMLAAAIGTTAGGNEGPTSATFSPRGKRRFLALFSEDRRRSFVKTDDETYELGLVDRDGDELEYLARISHRG